MFSCIDWQLVNVLVKPYLPDKEKRCSWDLTFLFRHSSFTYCYQLVNVITLGDRIKRLSLYNNKYLIRKEDVIESLSGFYCTVKPMLTATSKQQPPVNNQPGLCWYQFLLRNFYRATTYVQRPLFWGPKGGRCRQVWLYFKIAQYWNNFNNSKWQTFNCYSSESVPYLVYIGSKLNENTIPDFSNNVDKLLEGIENLLKNFFLFHGK